MNKTDIIFAPQLKCEEPAATAWSKPAGGDSSQRTTGPFPCQHSPQVGLAPIHHAHSCGCCVVSNNLKNKHNPMFLKCKALKEKAKFPFCLSEGGERFKLFAISSDESITQFPRSGKRPQN